MAQQGEISLLLYSNEFKWLLRHLKITNDAIIPVLNATRLKAIKEDNEASRGAASEEVKSNTTEQKSAAQ